MLDACFIIETLQDSKKTENIINIANTLGIKHIIPFHIKNLTKEQLVRNSDIVEPSANMNSNDLNNLIPFESEKRMLTFNEIKQYIEHKTAWGMIQDKKFNNVLVLDNSVVLKKEFHNNYLDKITEVLENAPPLYSVLALVDSGKPMNVSQKCNEFFNYTNFLELTQMGYIISKLGVKNFLHRVPLSPISEPIGYLMNKSRFLYKDIYVMKYPIFGIGTATPATEDITIITHPKRLSLPVKQVQHLFKKIYIINKDTLNNNLITLVSLFTLKLGISTYVKSKEEEVWEKVSKEKDDVFVVNNNVNIDLQQFSMHLGLIANEVPVDYKLIALSSRENTIKHPFRFSTNLDFVHPDMHEFSGYLLSKKGALMLLKNKEHKNRNLMLSREHYCFAYKNIMLKVKNA